MIQNDTNQFRDQKMNKFKEQSLQKRFWDLKIPWKWTNLENSRYKNTFRDLKMNKFKKHSL